MFSNTYKAMLTRRTCRCTFGLHPYSSNGRTSVAVSSSKNKSQSVKAIELQPLKGTRDFYPDDMVFKNYLFDKWRNIAKSYGYEEYDTSVLENESLYTIKSGDEIGEQLFNFVDKGGRKVTLRPEMTPSLARMIISKHANNKLTLPVKWYSFPQCWRYEKTTRGRRREHYQWNMDIWGVSSIEAEAELISILIATMKELGLSSVDVGIKINSRKIIGCIIQSLEFPEELFNEMCIIIDKMDKVPIDKIESLLIQSIRNHYFSNDDSYRLCSEEEISGKVKKLLETLNIKELKVLEDTLCTMNPSNSEAIVENIREFEYMIDLIENCYGHSVSNAGEGSSNSWLEFDSKIVRGLSYYTGVVFEAFDRSKTLRAICGGGRYDRLAQTLTNNQISLPAVGFGFGDAVIYELLLMKSLLPQLPTSKEDASHIMIFSPLISLVDGEISAEEREIHFELKKKAMKLAHQYRSAGTGRGIECNMNTDGVSMPIPSVSKQLKQFLKKANKNKARYVVLCPVEEHRNGRFIIKDMVQGRQCLVDNDDSAWVDALLQERMFL